MPELFAYTDGACSGNPGPGGWGVLLVARNGKTIVKQRTLCGGAPETTNNRMELLAAISALEALERPSAVTIVTDSAYVKNGVTTWIHGCVRVTIEPTKLDKDGKPQDTQTFDEERVERVGERPRAEPASKQTGGPAPDPVRLRDPAR